MDNIQNTGVTKLASSMMTPFPQSRSCESINQSKNCKSPKLPIAHNTAKIIQRAKPTNGNGVENECARNKTES